MRPKGLTTATPPPLVHIRTICLFVLRSYKEVGSWTIFHVPLHSQQRLSIAAWLLPSIFAAFFYYCVCKAVWMSRSKAATLQQASQLEVKKRSGRDVLSSSEWFRWQRKGIWSNLQLVPSQPNYYQHSTYLFNCLIRTLFDDALVISEDSPNIFFLNKTLLVNPKVKGFFWRKF